MTPLSTRIERENSHFNYIDQQSFELYCHFNYIEYQGIVTDFARNIEQKKISSKKVYLKKSFAVSLVAINHSRIK